MQRLQSKRSSSSLAWVYHAIETKAAWLQPIVKALATQPQNSTISRVDISSRFCNDFEYRRLEAPVRYASLWMVGFIVACVQSVALAADEQCRISGAFPPPDPRVASLEKSVDVNAGNTLGLKGCEVAESNIRCNFVYTRNQANSQDYQITPATLKRLRFFDDADESHNATNGFYCNRRGKAMTQVNLGSGDSIWIIYDFDRPANDINTARIIVPHESSGQVELRGRVIVHQ